MTTATQTQPQTQAGAPARAASTPATVVLTDFERLLQQSAKGGIEITPFGGDEKIKLSIPLVRQYIAVPAIKDNVELFPDDRQCMRFIMLCRSRKLNPFEGDAYMIPFWDKQKGRYEWSLITAHNAFLKRAEVHHDFGGMKSGTIISPGFQCRPCGGGGNLAGSVCPKCDGKGFVDEVEGDFVPREINDQEQRLVGGWCRVFFKQKPIPMYKRSSLEVYRKGFGVWLNDPGGMIVKVAEADALRSSFPTILGGMFLKEELDDAVNVAATVESSRPEPTGLQKALMTGMDRPQKGAVAPKPAKTAEKETKPVKEEEDDVPFEQAATAQNAPQVAPGQVAAVQTPSEPQTQQGAPATTQEPAKSESVTITEPEKPQRDADPAFAAKDGDPEAVASLKIVATNCRVGMEQLMAHLRHKKLAREGQKLWELSEAKLLSISQHLPAWMPEIEKGK